MNDFILHLPTPNDLDAVSGLALVSIAVVIVIFAARPKPLLFRWIYLLFALAMMSFALEHFVDAAFASSTPGSVDTVAKALAAVVSVSAAAVLWPLLPRVLDLPTYMQLQGANTALAVRVAERDDARSHLQRAVARGDDAEEMLRQSQKIEAIGQIAGGLAHDFNNLLGVILGNLDRASRLIPTDAKAASAIVDALAATDRASALVGQLMAFARRQPPVVARAIDVDRLLLALKPLIRSAAQRSDIVYDLDCAWSGCADANQFENAVLNLVVNARDAMPQGGRLTIRTRAVRCEGETPSPSWSPPTPGDYVVIEVADTGIGMTAEVRARAFEPFFTTKPVGLGTGLGLSQIDAFARQCGGGATLDSAVGEGTRVSLYLPRIARDETDFALSDRRSEQTMAVDALLSQDDVVAI